MTAQERHMTPQGIQLTALDQAVALIVERAKAIVLDEILTSEEAAAYTKYSRTQFDYLARAGKFRRHSMTENGTPRYTRRQLLEDIEAHFNGKRN